MIRNTRPRFSIGEVASHLGCSGRFVRREIKRGTLAVERVNKRVIWIRREVLTAYCQARGLLVP